MNGGQPDFVTMVGPKIELYIYKIGTGEWTKKEVDKASEFQAGIKAFSLCNLLGTNKTLLTGGVQVSNGSPLASAFEFSGGVFTNGNRKKNMGSKRYAHQSVSVKGNLMVLGGF